MSNISWMEFENIHKFLVKDSKIGTSIGMRMLLQNLLKLEQKKFMSVAMGVLSTKTPGWC